MLKTTGDIIDRLLYTETALETCANKVRKIAEWDETLAGAGKGTGG